MYNTHDHIIQQEMEALVADIKQAYQDSGKKTSGEFEKGLSVTYSPNKAVLEGYTYLAGRTAGKMPPVQNIEEWIKGKGIKPIEDKLSITGLAWAIAKKIAREGTNKDSSLKIYEQVITPERIQRIIDKVTEFNIQEFVNAVTADLRLLVKNA